MTSSRLLLLVALVHLWHAGAVAAAPAAAPAGPPSAAPAPSTTAPTAAAGANDSDAAWIWSPSQTKNKIPAGDCYFRKTFSVVDVEAAQLHVTADNRFELFVNGKQAAAGADWRQMQVLDVTQHLVPGRNVVAVRATNTDEGAAGLAVRVIIKQHSGSFVGYSSDRSWKTSVRRFQDWEQPQFNDANWVAAASFGLLGEALPWGNEVVVAGEGARFSLPQEFAVERLFLDKEVGSLIAMTFDARGAAIVSQEGGHLLKLTDSDGDGRLDRAAPYCDKINTAQGLLCIGSRTLAVGEGPEGPGLYRLRDVDRDGAAEEVVRLIGFRGSQGEHGPHGLRMGPDGLIYVVIGNFARADAAPSARSPYRKWYEGDAVEPKFEDAGGHAVGIPAPGGVVLRTDADGSFVEFVGGGLRNAYDLAFSPAGELFTYDADMEWDRGAPWYRPTRLNHVTAGAEMGWRSGWSKWPEYYFDSLPAALDVGAGSPTGVEFYDHYAFPAKYRGALFGCDWATGRIHAFTFTRHGGTFVAKDETFLRGQPLNATDCAVGPDGALYFCTGGRGTDGGLYRVRWTGKPDPALADMGRGIEQALRQPQFDADWSRARIAAVRQQLGQAWGEQLSAAVGDAERPLAERLRAVDLMVCFGPRPTDQLLQALAADPSAEVRAKAAATMWLSDGEAIRALLVDMLADSDALVRRTACESLARRGELPPAAKVLPLLADQDRFVAFAAMRLLELLPVKEWAPTVLRDIRPRPFCYGAAALANVERLTPTSKAIVERALKLLSGKQLAVEDRLDLLRLLQLALVHGKLDGQAMPQVGPQLLATYPTTDPLANRELVRLLVRMQTPGAAEKFAAELAKDQPVVEKLHIAAYASRLKTGWTPESKMAVLAFYEQARAIEGGYSVDKYVENFSRDFLEQFTLDEKRQLLSDGDKWPATALSVLAKLPAEPSPALLSVLRQLDRRVAPRCPESNTFRRLRVGVVAVLGATQDASSQQYLRSIYLADPEYRDPIAMSLTQHPEGENWNYLVDSLRFVDEPASQEIMSALTRVAQRPKEAAPYRQVILQGLRLGARGAAESVALINFWNGSPVADAERARVEPRAELNKCREWYAAKFPDAPPAELPADAGRDKWSFEELSNFIASDAGRRGDANRGAEVFAAQCANCHRCRGRGETIGPDLSTVAQRFQRKEILESIVFPSHVVSDQYASRIVIAGGKSYAGLVREQSDGGVVVLLSNGKQVKIAKREIDDVQPSGVSTMPTGLLNAVSLDQVGDLFAYLAGAREATTEGVAEKGAADRK
jgi:putative heme-binding domain-containing protein